MTVALTIFAVAFSMLTIFILLSVSALYGAFVRLVQAFETISTVYASSYAAHSTDPIATMIREAMENVAPSDN